MSDTSERVAEPAETRPLIAFVHIPKTAGGTVTTIFTAEGSTAAVKNVGNYFTGPRKAAKKLTKRPGAWRRWQRDGGRMAVGHVPYGVVRRHLQEESQLGPEEVGYITFLREPVDRVLSHYYRHFHRRDPARAGRVKVRRDGKPQKSRTDSLEQAMVEMRIPQLNNLMTRFLCDDPSPESLPARAVEEAKENLREFAFVGITERFDESMALLSRKFGLDAAPYEDRHVNASRPSAEGVSDDERALIVEHNTMDIELYGLGVELFEQALAETPGELDAHVAQLRELSAAANDDAERALSEARDWLDRELPPGTSKPVAALLEAGEQAGIPRINVKKAARLLSATKEHRGERIWIRPAAD